MSRLPYRRRRALTGLAAFGSFVVLVPAIALAQAPAPRPVIDSAPSEIAYARTVVIQGHVENSTGREEISLQQHRACGDWRTVATKIVDEDSEVRFARGNTRKTKDYRLAWTDEVQQTDVRSDAVTVKVLPKLKLRVRPNDIFIGRTVKLRGALYPAIPGRKVILQQMVAGQWRRIARVAAGDGDFLAKFRARHKGLRRVRAIFRGDGLNSSSRIRKPLKIYREDLATWYGPGFYGNSTACGKMLKRSTLGVAHRTLPCGTRVSILYGGRTITVQVIDRGPYSGANWDLTEETADRLGFSGSDEIGVTK